MKQCVIIAGAGISVDYPSNLPNWWEYNKKLLNQIKKEALKLCPDAVEILNNIDAEKGLPIQCISQLIVSQGAGESYFPLLEFLNGSNPNANHFALAELARQGKLQTIVTTNFDTLIETAFRKEAIPLFTVVRPTEYYETPEHAICKLIKIHGSVHDHNSLIDTVNQKATGLSSEKRYILEEIFSDSEILVIGFSGSDLDFDINYIPFTQALKHGSKLTWIVHPNSKLNSNVIQLQKKYPDQISVKNVELSEFFLSLGIDYKKIKNDLKEEKCRNNLEELNKRIEELFSCKYIGPHGCIGYCLTMLEMIGDNKGAAALARLYEKVLDWESLDMYSVLGINALAHQKLIEKDFEGSVRCYETVLLYHMKTNEQVHKFLDQNPRESSPVEKHKQELEYTQNIVATYLNLGVVYYYSYIVQNKEDTLKKAEEMFQKAFLLIQKEPSIPLNSLMTFNLGRVKYRKSGDYDQYLNTLRISKAYAKNEGRLDTLAEILHEECDVRLMIGEYYLAAQALSYSEKVLKNVGRVTLERQRTKLCQQYQKRTGNSDQTFTENDIQKLQEKIHNPIRKKIVYFEVQKQKNIIAGLFAKLCQEYLKSENWLRLEDLSRCYLDAANTDIQRSNAWYWLGCSLVNQANYAEAKKYFSQIIDLGDRADQIKLGWSHCEFSKLMSNEGNAQYAVYHFGECLRILQKNCPKKELTSAGINCIRSLFQNNFFAEAKKCADQILTSIDKTEAKNVKALLEQLRKMNNPIEYKDNQDIPPQFFANDAIKLYCGGNRRHAWERMTLAKNKYQECGDIAGVGRCENNMGSWCVTEENYDCAIEHFKKALEIKHALGDTDGIANQLAALLQLFLKQSNYEKAKKTADYVARHICTFSYTQSKYVLYYSMFEYYFKKNEYALALEYGKKAEEGLHYLAVDSKTNIKRLSDTITLLKNMFEQPQNQKEITKYEEQIQEAIRLYKTGRLEESFSALNRLHVQYGYDPLKEGEIEGTCANAYLYNQRYLDAVDCFEKAIKIFETVDESQWDLAQDKLMVAVNGLAIALGHLGRNEDALKLLRRALNQKNLSCSNRISITITLCNRLVLQNQDSVKKDTEIFNDVKGMLDSLGNVCRPDHEQQGTIYCVYGMLYMVADDTRNSKLYYTMAKKEFLITNSPQLERVDQALKTLGD